MGEGRDVQPVVEVGRGHGGERLTEILVAGGGPGFFCSQFPPRFSRGGAEELGVRAQVFEAFGALERGFDEEGLVAVADTEVEGTERDT